MYNNDAKVEKNMDKDLKYFIKDKYSIIKIMIENEVKLKGKMVVPLTQDDLAELTGFSKAKVNDAVRDFIDKGYINFVSSGIYTVSALSKKIYDYLEASPNKWTSK